MPKRYFNTEGVCYPDEHYMVNLGKRLSQIKELVDQKKYFVINRGRQYGKTTTLFALAEYLKTDYLVVSLDFQQLSSEQFKTEERFASAFSKIFSGTLVRDGGEPFVDESALKSLSTENPALNLQELFKCLSNLCATAQKPIVLIIDEVDQASNNQVFIDFLAQLRFYYLNRKNTSTFQSVILAGVYDIKNLKLKLRSETDHQFNSPWNIAAKFSVSMEFSPEDIESMLKEYEADHGTGMDTPKIAQLIYDYTSGYPVLVSNICKVLDEELPNDNHFPTLAEAWTEKGVAEAVKLIVKGPENKVVSVMIFESLTKHIKQYPELGETLKRILFQGDPIPFNPTDLPTNLGVMFGYVCKRNGSLQIANRMFEMWLYDAFLAEEPTSNPSFQLGASKKPLFIKNNKLDMELVMRMFAEYFSDLFQDNNDDFIEKQGRRMFLLYLRPIINGSGSYYIEAETRNMRRMDVIVDCLEERHVIELKIWHGEKYNEAGEKQLVDYLKEFHLDKGYLLTFSFIKSDQKKIKTVQVEGKTLLEVVV